MGKCYNMNWIKFLKAVCGLSIRDSSGKLTEKLTEWWLPLGRRPAKRKGKHLLFI